MAQCFLLCLILGNAFVAVASENANFQHPPAPAPYKAEASTIRKLGKHEAKVVRTFGSAPAPAPGPAPSSPSQLPYTEKNVPTTAGGSPSAEQNTATTEASNEGNVSNIHPAEKRHHSSMDKSVAGGGVILGGLATTFLVAVFCYIRATGRHKSETHQSTTTEVTH